MIGCWAKNPVYIVSVFSSKGFRVSVSSDYLRPQNICAHRPGGACTIWANFLQQWKPEYRWQSNCFRWISAFLCFRSKLKNRLAPQEKVRIARCKVQINDRWPSKPSIWDSMRCLSSWKEYICFKNSWRKRQRICPKAQEITIIYDHNHKDYHWAAAASFTVSRPFCSNWFTTAVVQGNKMVTV